MFNCPNFLQIRPSTNNPKTGILILPQKTFLGIKQCQSYIIDKALSIQFLGCVEFNTNCNTYQWFNVSGKQKLCSLPKYGFGFCLKIDSCDNDYLYIYFCKRSIKPNVKYILNNLNTICTFNKHVISNVNLLILLYGRPESVTDNIMNINRIIQKDIQNSNFKPKNTIINYILPQTQELVFSYCSSCFSNIKVTGG